MLRRQVYGKGGALSEIVGIIKVLMETVEPGEGERICGDRSLVSRANVQMTKNIIKQAQDSTPK